MPKNSMGALLALWCIAITAPAAAQEFYKGKTISLIVGNAPGGGYDHYARLLARHMPRYIPGEPNIVVKNMPGAGGMVMSNAMYSQVVRDGLSFGAGSVPSEAIRNTRVVTSTYDVARGQFTGGQIASTTRGGTNNVQGALSYSLRDPSLEFVDDSNPTFGQKYTQNQIRFGAGGPIIKDKLFTFGALTFSRRTDPLLSLLAADPLTLQRLGTNPDSVNRFLNLVQGFGLPLTSPLAPDERLNTNTAALVRVDYNLAEDHSLMIRGDWRGSTQLG